MDIKTKLVHAAMEYDRKQQGKRGYNPYALAQYFAAIDNVLEGYANGSTIRQALLNNFCGRLLDVMLRAVGEPKHTKDEMNNQF